MLRTSAQVAVSKILTAAAVRSPMATNAPSGENHIPLNEMGSDRVREAIVAPVCASMTRLPKTATLPSELTAGFPNTGLTT